MIRNLWLDFALFWGIKVPAFITRVAASLPSDRDVQDRALWSCGVAAVVLFVFLQAVQP